MAIQFRESLYRLFNIYPGEGRNAFLFAFLGFLWAVGITTALKFADALFLVHVGAHSLPTAYTLTACGMLGVASLLLLAFHHLSSYKIYHSALLIGILFYLSAFFFQSYGSGTETTWFWYALKIFGFFLFSVATTCFWTFVDQYHHLQDAKRLYTLFSASIFLGAASTGLIMRLGILNLDSLFLFIATLLFLTILWVRKIAKQLPLIVHEEAEPEQGASDPNNSLRFLIKSILTSRFTLFLMMGNMLMQLLLVFTEYNYMATFERYFAANTPEAAAQNGGATSDLTLFLGKCIAVVGVANLIIGLFFYSRLIRRFGVTSLIFVTPILLIIAFSGWSFTDSLLFPLIGFFVAEGTLYVIDDSNFNLLLNAVPYKLKYKIRVMIESFFEPIGMLISASLLALLQEDSKLVGIGLSACALLIAAAIQSQYLKALFFNLADNAIHFQRSIYDWIRSLSPKEQKGAESRLLAILKYEDTPIQLFACEGLLAFYDASILKKLLTYASEWDSDGKVKFLNLLEKSPFAKDKLVLDCLEKWSQEDLRSSIYFYLAKQGLLPADEAVAFLNSTDLQLQASAIIALKDDAYAQDRLKTLLESVHEKEILMGIEILGIIGSTDNVHTLLPYLKNPSLPIARAAAQAISQTIGRGSSTYAVPLIGQLTTSSDNDVRLACLKALGKINDFSLISPIILSSIHFRPNERRLTESIISQFGIEAVPILLEMVNDIKIHDRCRLLAGRILGRVDLNQLRAHLSGIVHHEIERAYFYFYHSQMIQEQHPDLDLGILKDTLWTGYQSVIDFIIQLLGVAGEAEDCELLSRCLRSRNPKTRSQVIEALEKTCETPIFRLIQPLVDEVPYLEKMKAYALGNRTPLSLTELLDRISESPAQVDQIISAALKYELNLPGWREALKKQMTSQDEVFQHFAHELLET